MANPVVVRDFKKIKSEDIQVIKLDTIEEVQDIKLNKGLRKKKSYIKEEYVNPIEFSVGIQRDEFQKKNGIFVESIAPSFGALKRDWVNKFFGYEFDANISPNSLIARQNLHLGFGKNGNYELFVFAQVGQKVNFEDQIDSGYLFFNGGVGASLLLRGFVLRGKIYTTLSKSQELGLEGRLLAPFKKFRLGVYAGVEQYNPTTAEFDREGQTSLRGGLILQY